VIFFAGFRIVRLLVSGGLREIYLAEHARLPRRNALKVLPADVSADPEYRARFSEASSWSNKISTFARVLAGSGVAVQAIWMPSEGSVVNGKT
jgi:serine/threonine protein kinase